jgi:hypothetical protein|tara:strand:+ start:1132 stop:1554 length:423 start_codon:yes stop_codon:yes gene_type:complete
MYIFHYCKKINDYLFDEKLNTKLKEKIINTYNLKEIGKIKEYWENNVKITSLNGKLSFEYVNDLSISYLDGLLIEEYKKEICLDYNFYKVDIEEEYILYENEMNELLIKLKIYDDYISIEYHSDKKLDSSIFEIIEMINN